jgi:hypothetical protein
VNPVFPPPLYSTQSQAPEAEMSFFVKNTAISYEMFQKAASTFSATININYTI